MSKEGHSGYRDLNDKRMEKTFEIIVVLLGTSATQPNHTDKTQQGYDGGSTEYADTYPHYPRNAGLKIAGIGLSLAPCPRSSAG
jgi:hypothetical protein